MQVFSPIPEDTFGVLWGRLAALVGLWCAYLGPKHSHAASCICECRNKRLRRSGIVFMLPTRGKLSGLFYSPLFLCFLFLILLHFFLLIPPPPSPPLHSSCPPSSLSLRNCYHHHYPMLLHSLFLFRTIYGNEYIFLGGTQETCDFYIKTIYFSRGIPYSTKIRKRVNKSMSPENHPRFPK